MRDEKLVNRIHRVMQHQTQWEPALEKSFYNLGTQRIYFSPIPGKCGDEKELIQTAEHLEDVMPLQGRVDYYIGHMCDNSGFPSTCIEVSSAAHSIAPDHCIWLPANPYGIHPAVWRFAITHAYSRCLVRELAILDASKRENLLGKPIETLIKKYAAIRLVEPDMNADISNTHLSTVELACHDVRVCVFGIEPEFWPHEAIHPEVDQKVKLMLKNYWQGLRNKYSVTS